MARREIVKLVIFQVLISSTLLIFVCIFFYFNTASSILNMISTTLNTPEGRSRQAVVQQHPRIFSRKKEPHGGKAIRSALPASDVANATATNACIIVSNDGRAGKKRLKKFASKYVITCKPTMYFIGVSKSATTSLSVAFIQHPFMHGLAHGNECAALLYGVPRGLSSRWQSCSTGKCEFTEKAGTKYAKLLVEQDWMGGNATNMPLIYLYKPNTMYYPLAAKNVFESERQFQRAGYPYQPEGPRFLVMLREPVSRTFSSWAFKWSMDTGKETRPWESAVYGGLATLASTLDCLYKGSHDWSSTDIRLLESECSTNHFDPRLFTLHHVMKSVYSLQFELWFSYFPSTSFHVLFMEDFIDKPVRALETTLAFLGLSMLDEDEGVRGYKTLEEAIKAVTTVLNQTKDKKNPPKLTHPTEDTVKQLSMVFEPFNCRLAQQLGVVRTLAKETDEVYFSTTQVSSSLGPGSRVSWLTDWVTLLGGAVDGDSEAKEGKRRRSAYDPCQPHEEVVRSKLKSLLLKGGGKKKKRKYVLL